MFKLLKKLLYEKVFQKEQLQKYVFVFLSNVYGIQVFNYKQRNVLFFCMVLVFEI